MKWFDNLVRQTAEFKRVTAEYASIFKSHEGTIKLLDESNDHLMDRILKLNKDVELARADRDALIKKYTNIPDAAKHLEVVSECERLKFANLNLEGDVRTLEQKVYDLTHDQVLLVPPPPVNNVVVLETPLRKKTKSLKEVKAAETKRRATKAVKSPKYARGTPRRKRS